MTREEQLDEAQLIAARLYNEAICAAISLPKVSWKQDVPFIIRHVLYKMCQAYVVSMAGNIRATVESASAEMDILMDYINDKLPGDLDELLVTKEGMSDEHEHRTG